MKHVLRRTWQGAISLTILFTLVFFLIRTLPGDPARLMAGPSASPDQVATLRRQLGLDKSIGSQYLDFLQRLVNGDLGQSTMSSLSVTDEIAARLPFTALLVLAGMALAVCVAVPSGVVAARFRNGGIDLATTVFAVGLTSIPAFWLALTLIDWLSVRAGIFPTSGADSWLHLVLPAIVLAATQVGIITRLVRGSVIDTLNADYVRTARAKGVKRSVVLRHHALRNALVPAVTVIGLQTGLLVGGAVVTESVFNWPGVGRLLIQAVLHRDYPVLQGLILLFGVTFIVINLVVDLVNMAIDPRLRES